MSDCLAANACVPADSPPRLESLGYVVEDLAGFVVQGDSGCSLTGRHAVARQTLHSALCTLH